MLKRLTVLLPPVFFLIAAVIVHRELKSFQVGDIRDAIDAVPYTVIALGVGLTALNYAVLSFYDWLALRQVGQKVPLSRVMLASSISYAISNNTGHALISGTSVRYRFYTHWGVPGGAVVRVSVFLALTFIVGLFSLELATAIFLPHQDLGQIATPGVINLVTAICGACMFAYWAGILFIRKPIKIGSREFSLPSVGVALLQTLISSLDLLLAAVILYLFLRQTVDISFAAFLTIYVVAMILGLASQVPGGLGIFEGAFLWMAGPDISNADLMGGLIVFRIVYYFLPLAVAGVGLLAHEAITQWENLRGGTERVFIVLKYLVPRLFAPLLALSGAMLLFFGATPQMPADIAWLRTFIPLGVLEFSHLAGSMIGLLLLFLSRGVYLRLDAAYYGGIFLSALGIASVLLQGLHYGEAIALTVLLILFLPTRRYFDRRSSLLDMSFTPVWLFSILAVLAGTAWIGLFYYKHVDYDNQLWWQFTFKGDAPRFLRAMALTSILAIGFALYRLLGVARPLDIRKPTAQELDRAREVAAASMNDTTGFLALLGDKQLLWSEDGNAFIMFGMTRRYWIAMGDPVGEAASFPGLLWRFREESDKHGAKAVFYEVSEQHLPLYLDLGLALLKVGQEARVETATFSLEGGKKENQRKTRNRFTKQGFVMRFLDAAEVQLNMPRLLTISDQWLEMKAIDEKGFSLGFFDPDYLARTSVAVVEKEGRIYAFANLWELDNREEVSVDLMRYAPEAPTGTMEYLFVELISWAQGAGFRWFDLGMAPLSGLERHPLAPMWHKIGTLIYRHGDEFYNFEGLHAYKEKFGPTWRARYLAAPPGPRLPLVLLNTAAVISGRRSV